MYFMVQYTLSKIAFATSMWNGEKMGKIDINKKKKRESLLETAFELFTSKGINETSISEIVNKAGVAKGTFYLYFRDKYDVRNLLISHKSSQIFLQAVAELEKQNIVEIDEKIVFLANNIIDQLNENKSLLTFISKNLSWGYFKSAVSSPTNSEDVNFREAYYDMLEKSGYNFKEPEIMIYMIVELVSSACYSSILYEEPCDIEKIKPYIFDNIRFIVNSHKSEKSVKP